MVAAVNAGLPATSTSPRVTVVLLNWNGWQDTLSCLASVRAQTYPNLEVLLVDNGSTDGSVGHIRQTAPDVELLQTGANLGFGGGCNVGLRHALASGASYIWLLNSDALADSKALSALVDIAVGQPGVGAVGSVIFNAGTLDTIQLWGGGRVNLWLGRSVHLVRPGAPDFISAASVLLRSNALQDVGLFDEAAFFMYWEDTDLSFRMRQAGWQLAVADGSRVWHQQGASLGPGNPLLDEYFTRSTIRFLRRYAPVASLSICLTMVRLLVRRALAGQTEKIRAVVKGFRGA